MPDQEVLTCEDCESGFTNCDDRYLGCFKDRNTNRFWPANCFDFEEALIFKEGGQKV